MTLQDLRPLFHRSIKVALIVGPVLTLINQWEAVSTFQRPDMLKVALTFMVPFCVSFSSGYSMRKSVTQQMDSAQAQIADLRAEVRKATHEASEARRALAVFTHAAAPQAEQNR
ncbi:nitrate/nitrite transporter NrtS [uncultured Roseobacter sp.]|uniref:nitrate/nitrite transporter NrtS n=1 Tax=uncultured Roseobacter sp. TaxID=114847 RepID=UPI002635EDBC|nr:nitrate/nitrite transporter NrtS [uncultured Roseobacter sp.]